MSKVKGTSKEHVSGWLWKNVRSCVVGQSSHFNSDKIAGFDMDSTLIEPKSGNVFPKDAQDWKYWHESVPAKMKQLASTGYKIVIFTNQKGISVGKTKQSDIKQKIQDITKDLGIQMQAIISKQDDQFRKPSTSMWDLFIQQNGKVDLNKSFYCGDAAGRKQGKKKDISDSDLKFALNVGIQFYTPQNLFLGDKKKIQVTGFQPSTIPQNGKLFANSNDTQVKFGQKQLVIFVGGPGSGKSTFLHNYMPKYERVNRDTLKTKQKCYSMAQKYINEGKSVIIDNTNPKKEDRKYFLDLAKKHNYKTRCFNFLTTKQICFHNDKQRVCNLIRKHYSGKVGKIPIHTFFKTYQKPTLDQGYYQIKEVNFIAKFNDDKDKKQYLKYTRAD